jgi:hypothetical protein
MYTSGYVIPITFARAHHHFFTLHHSESISSRSPRGSGSFLHISLSFANNGFGQNPPIFTSLQPLSINTILKAPYSLLESLNVYQSAHYI